eukprot:gene10331-11435_t
MSFGDMSRARLPDNRSPLAASLSPKGSSAPTPQQLSQAIAALQKKCSVIKEKILILRRKQVNQQEKFDLDKELTTLKQEAGLTGAQIEAHRLKVDKSATLPNITSAEVNIQRAALNKLVKDFDLVKTNIDIVSKESQLVKVALVDITAKDSFSRVGQADASNGYTSSAYVDEGHASAGGGGGGGGAGDRRDQSPTLMYKQEQIQMTVVDVDDLLIMEREKDIKQLHHDLSLVKDMYQDMANLVERSGAHIDAIYESTDTSHEQAKAGLEQVKQAAAYQPGCVTC